MNKTLTISQAHNVVSDNFKFQPTGIEIRGKPTYEEWVSCGKFIKYVDGALQWWRGDWSNYGEQAYGDKYAQEIDIFGKSYSTIANERNVAKNFEFYRRRENLFWDHHASVTVSDLSISEQEKLLDVAEKKGLTCQQFREYVRNYRIAKNNKSLPVGIYNLFYADPPWEYGNSGLQEYGHAQSHYETMTIDELCALPIQKLLDENAVLFIWVTSPLLEDSFHVIRAWGFEYKSSFVWDKVKHNFGYYNSMRHEFLLICTRGSFLPESAELFDSVVTVERSDEHSEKPEAFTTIIEAMYPNAKKIELFARQKRKGWDVWGNQVT